MTKHRPEFIEHVRETPDTQDLVSFIRRTGFMVATQRTKAMLDVLAKAGLLVCKTRYIVREGKRKAIYRYTPSNRGS